MDFPMFSLAFCHFSWLVHKLEGLALYSTYFVKLKMHVWMTVTFFGASLERFSSRSLWYLLHSNSLHAIYSVSSSYTGSLEERMLTPTGVDKELRGDKKCGESSGALSKNAPALRAPTCSHISRGFSLPAFDIDSSLIPQSSFRRRCDREMITRIDPRVTINPRLKTNALSTATDLSRPRKLPVRAAIAKHTAATQVHVFGAFSHPENWFSSTSACLRVIRSNKAETETKTQPQAQS